MDLPESLLRQYISHRVEDLEILQTMRDSNNFDRCAAIGHRLKGSGPAYGFKELGVIGIAIQAAADDRSAEKISSQLELLAQWIEAHHFD